MKPEEMSESLLIFHLKQRYASPEYALIPQVRNCTGFASTVRTADALCMSLYPSRGLTLTGFEIKISRSDWMHELKQPNKAEAICQFCDFWCLVVADEEIVKTGELPSTWGLLAFDGKKLKTIKEPSKMEAKPLDRPMLAAIFRKMQMEIPRGELNQKMKKEIEESYQRALEFAKINVRDDLIELAHLRKSVLGFEAASGIKINTWDVGNIGEAVKYVKDWNQNRALNYQESQLKSIQQQTEAMLDNIKRHHQALKCFRGDYEKEKTQSQKQMDLIK